MKKLERKKLVNNIDTSLVNIPSLNEIQLENVKIAQEQFGVKVLSIKELGELELTPTNVELLQRNIYRENRIISGEYTRDRNTQYLRNYIEILENLNINPKLIDGIKETMGKMGNKYMVSSLLPPLKDWYIYLKRGRDKKGRFISINEQTDTLEEQISTALTDLKELGYA